MTFDETDENAFERCCFFPRQKTESRSIGERYVGWHNSSRVTPGPGSYITDKGFEVTLGTLPSVSTNFVMSLDSMGPE
eukprot:5525098-Amphidinium_carterae.1